MAEGKRKKGEGTTKAQRGGRKENWKLKKWGKSEANFEDGGKTLAAKEHKEHKEEKVGRRASDSWIPISDIGATEEKIWRKKSDGIRGGAE